MGRTIRDYIRGNIGATYQAVTDDGGYDGKTSGKPDAFGMAIERTMAYLFVPGTSEEDLDALGDEFVKGFAADAATRTVIPFCIDYYSTNTGLSDTLQPAPVGNPILRASTRQQYNRVEELQRIDGILATRITVARAQFQARAGGLIQLVGTSGGIGISSYGTTFLTADPDSFMLVDPGRIFSPGFGVIGVRTDPVVVSRPVTVVEGAGGPLFP